MQIVKYEINNNILVVGFKENNFVVYSQITYDNTKTKEELLQRAYVQCKNSIEYEKTQTEHSFTTEEKGEFFVPEYSKATKLKIDFNNLEGIVLDQYGKVLSTNVLFFIQGTDKASIINNQIVEKEVVEDTKYFIVAKFGNLEEKQERIIYAPQIPMPPLPTDIEILRLEQAQNTVEMLELISALNEFNRLEQAQSSTEMVELIMAMTGGM